MSSIDFGILPSSRTREEYSIRPIKVGVLNLASLTFAIFFIFLNIHLVNSLNISHSLKSALNAWNKLMPKKWFLTSPEEKK